MSVGLCGHSSSGCFRKSGPCIKHSLFNNASTVIPLDALLAGFCIVSTCLHCVVVDWSRIAEILFATKVWNLLPLFSVQQRTQVLSVQKVDWSIGKVTSCLIIRSSLSLEPLWIIPSLKSPNTCKCLSSFLYFRIIGRNLAHVCRSLWPFFFRLL